MRSLVVCVLLLAAGAAATQVACTREYIINGLLFIADTDRDDAISVAEANAVALYRPCGPDPLHFNGEFIIVNSTQGGCDCAFPFGLLTAADFDCPDSCMRSDALWLFLCNKIAACMAYNAV